MFSFPGCRGQKGTAHEFSKINVGGWSVHTTKLFLNNLHSIDFNLRPLKTKTFFNPEHNNHAQSTESFPSTPLSTLSIWGKTHREEFISLFFFSLLLFWFKELVSLKCDLNPVFRRKGALLWPPLHPSPHFHPPCLGRRTKALKRLSTSSLGPHLVGRSKSTFEPLTMSPSYPPSLSPVLLCAASYLPCCMSRPSTSCHHASRYLPPSASSSWRGQTTGIVWFCEKARPLPDCWVFGQRTCACDAAPAHFF